MIETNYILPDNFSLEQTYPELKDLKVIIDNLNFLILKEHETEQSVEFELNIEWTLLMLTSPLTMLFAFIPAIYSYFFSIKPLQQRVDEIDEHIRNLQTKLREVKNGYRQIAMQTLKEFDDAWDEIKKRSAPPTKIVNYSEAYFGEYNPNLELQLTLAHAVEKVKTY